MKDIIDKAVKGGYEPISKDSSMYGTEWTISDNSIKTLIGIIPFDTIIFSHDFLKAFFGDVKCDCERKGYSMHSSDCSRKPWPYYAQQLVLSTDRKEYLERFI